MKSNSAVLVLIVLLSLALPLHALAGGWAVITLDELPAGIQAGEDFTVRFAVRQHGRTLMEGLTPQVTARQSRSGQSIQRDALPVEGQPGIYQVSLELPTPGIWTWWIQAFSMNQRMPDLQVASAASVSPAPVNPGIQPYYWIGAASLALILAGLGFLLRKQKSWALSALLAAVLIGGAGFASAADRTQPPSPDPA